IEKGDYDALEKAVSLYRGPFLEGCLEFWVVHERDRRAQAVVEAMETLATRAHADGAIGVAVNHLRQAISVDFWQESAHRLLMKVLEDSGDYSAALQVYRDLRDRLRSEHKDVPQDSTTKLYEKIWKTARQRASNRPIAPSDAPLQD